MILQSPEHPQKVRLDQINDELSLLSFIVKWVILVAKQHKLQAKLFFLAKKTIFLKRLSQWFPYQILVLVPHHAKSVLRSSSPTMSLLRVIQTRLNAGLSMKQQSLYWIFLSTEKSINIDQEYQLILSWHFMLYHSSSQAYIPVIHLMSRYLFPYFQKKTLQRVVQTLEISDTWEG